NIHNTFPTRRSSDLKESRFKHILGVEKSAIELAKQNDYSTEKASIAALVHDYAKERTPEEFKKTILDEKLSKDLLNWNNFIWHGDRKSTRLNSSHVS